MKPETYLELKNQIIQRGYEKEVAWAESLNPCLSPDKFLDEYIWVVLNAGMKEQVARGIFSKIQEAMQNDIPILEVFAHKGKADAISKMLGSYQQVFCDFQKAADKLTYLESLSWIGKITKYHLARNLGIDCVKPDRHLVRIAKYYGITCFDMCEKLSKETGDNLSTVDLVIWRAANLGII
jgi:hypothetical protein